MNMYNNYLLGRVTDFEFDLGNQKIVKVMEKSKETSFTDFLQSHVAQGCKLDASGDSLPKNNTHMSVFWSFRTW